MLEETIGEIPDDALRVSYEEARGMDYKSRAYQIMLRNLTGFCS